jgi:hypothetical protein
MRGLRKNNSRQHGFLPLLRSRPDGWHVWFDELFGGFRNRVIF